MNNLEVSELKQTSEAISNKVFVSPKLYKYARTKNGGKEPVYV